MHIQTYKPTLYDPPADLQILLHLSQRLHFVLSMAPLQQTVPTHVHPLIGAVVAQYLSVLWAPSLGEVAQRIHQKVGAERRPLQMRLEMCCTQRYFTPQAGLDSQCWLSLRCLWRAAVTQHLAVLLLTLGADEATFALTLIPPRLADAGRAEAVTTGQRKSLAEDVSAHRAGQLLLQGRHRDRIRVPLCGCHTRWLRVDLITSEKLKTFDKLITKSRDELDGSQWDHK